MHIPEEERKRSAAQIRKHSTASMHSRGLLSHRSQNGEENDQSDQDTDDSDAVSDDEMIETTRSSVTGSVANNGDENSDDIFQQPTFTLPNGAHRGPGELKHMYLVVSPRSASSFVMCLYSNFVSCSCLCMLAGFPVFFHHFEEGVLDVTAGASCSGVISSYGNAYAWGRGFAGRLGCAEPIRSTVPPLQVCCVCE